MVLVTRSPFFKKESGFIFFPLAFEYMMPHDCEKARGIYGSFLSNNKYFLWMDAEFGTFFSN
ncbi:hypothetical protein CUU66_02655 [Peribacillus deserti]|uniref:Uncharacterized protein n=1 Tax=Peribacillus deserti TaxID=673318 RepID=A0A2N5MAJ4_9BACI|nr:hypothetical protein CUU66_02655 [Peribacillus deserti]